MKYAGAFATTLALTACATSPTTPTEPLATHEPVNSESKAPVDVVEVDVQDLANADTYECEKRAPTGTRIAVEQCAAANTASDTLARTQMLEDIEQLRRQQIQYEQARQQAILESMTRPVGTPSR